MPTTTASSSPTTSKSPMRSWQSTSPRSSATVWSAASASPRCACTTSSSRASCCRWVTAASKTRTMAHRRPRWLSRFRCSASPRASPALSQQRALPPLLEPTATGDGSDLVQDSGGLRRRKPAPEFSLRTGAKDGAMVPKMSQLSLFAAQEATRHALPPEVRAHWVILTQILDDLEHIVVRLRRPHLTSRSIVIVCPLHDWSHLSDDRAWKRINAFPGVHLIKGIPQQEEDLARANVRESQGVILVSGKSEADAVLVQIDSNT